MSRKNTLKHLMKYLDKCLAYIVSSLAMSILYVGFSLYIPILIGRAIDNIISVGHVNFKVILTILMRVGVSIILAIIGQWIMSICNNKITYTIVKNMRNDAFEKLQVLPMSYIDKHPYGDTVSRIITDADQVADGLLLGFSQLFTGVVTIAWTLIFMLKSSLMIGLVVVVLTPISLFVARFIAKRTYSMFEMQSKARGEQTALVDEMISNLELVKSMGYEDDSIERFEKGNETLREWSLKGIFFSSITNPSTRFVNSIVYAAVGVLGAIYAMYGGITVGGLSCFLTYANQYTKPFNDISGVVTELQNAIACASRLFELIDELPAQTETQQGELPKEDTSVRFEDVYFSYVTNKPLIENFSLDVEPGKKVAIVGPTGCGKTTLINLLMRFYDVKSGKIVVSKRDVKDMMTNAHRENFGMVLQDTWLMSGTIRENIALGKPDATMDEIVEAAKASHAHSFIKRLKNGYDTVVDDSSSGLSVGQRQLICITRVMLCLPPMLILDEATSSIDTRTEMRIQRAFEKLMNGRTSFIVAHRLSTIKNADVILVMKDGKIIEQGNHNQLINLNGFYKELYEASLI